MKWNMFIENIRVSQHSLKNHIFHLASLLLLWLVA